MKYEEDLALVLGGKLGYLPNDGSGYSLLMKKKYQGNPYECIFFYGNSGGKARGPRRVLIFDSQQGIQLEQIEQEAKIESFCGLEKELECEIPCREIEEAVALMDRYKALYGEVSEWAFEEKLEEIQREKKSELGALLRDISGEMYVMYQCVSPEFIEWLEG